MRVRSLGAVAFVLPLVWALVRAEQLQAAPDTLLEGVASRSGGEVRRRR